MTAGILVWCAIALVVIVIGMLAGHSGETGIMWTAYGLALIILTGAVVFGRLLAW